MDYKLAVLIPTKNRKILLQRALTSVITQDVLPNEIIVVNDGSQDDTVDFLNKFITTHSAITFQIINRGESGGVNTARNEGVKVSKSEWVAFLDDDDEFVPGALKKMQTQLLVMPKYINVVYFNSIIDNGQSNVLGGFQFDEGQKEYDPTYEETMTKFQLRGDCKPVFRKSLFNNHFYRFPETVNGYESYTMNLIARDNKGIRYVRDVSTLVHFDMTHSHISHTAPRKNPQPLLDLHIKQLEEHREFYKKNPKQLEEKYLTMVKLAIRASNIKALVLYSVRFLLSKIRT